MSLFRTELLVWLSYIALGIVLYYQFFSKRGHTALTQEQAQAQRDLVTEARQMNALLKRVVEEQSARIAALEAKYETLARSVPPS